MTLLAIIRRAMGETTGPPTRDVFPSGHRRVLHDRPPSPVEVVAALTPEDRARLDAEAAAGDVLARLVLDVLADDGRHVPAREIFPITTNTTTTNTTEPVQGRLGDHLK